MCSFIIAESDPDTKLMLQCNCLNVVTLLTKLKEKIALRPRGAIPSQLSPDKTAKLMVKPDLGLKDRCCQIVTAMHP